MAPVPRYTQGREPSLMSLGSVTARSAGLLPLMTPSLLSWPVKGQVLQGSGLGPLIF